MVLSEISIRRPVLATVMSLMIVLVGLVAWQRLPVREYPNIDEPVVTVETSYRGASAEIVESRVTTPLEESLSGIEGIEVMSSISRQEKSQITLRFRVSRNADAAANDVRDRVARVRNNLPEAIDEPVVAKVEADAQPIIYIAFASDRLDALAVTDIADRIAKPLLQNLDGVAEVRIFGARKYAMRLWLDPVRIAGFGLTPADVEGALRRQNVEVPSGRVESRDREFNVVAETDMRTAEEFQRLVIADRGGYLVRLSDIGRAEIGAEEERAITRFNGQPAVALGVIKQSTANPLAVSRAINAALPELARRLPEGVRAELAYDSAVFIDKAISNVFTVIGEAVLLVLLVIFLFLRSLRATLIPLVTIPVSLIGAFAIMAVLGFSINTLTLLAMVLAVGLVVDDAIVMLENIARHVEQGMKPFEAALKGSAEIGFAVVAMTFTLAAVYIPVALQSGRTGRLFVEFALTLAATVIVSGFVALTLSPMMCSKLLKTGAHHGAAFRFGERVLDALTAAYRRSLRFALSVRPVVLAVGLLAGMSSWTFLQVLRSELSPVEDRGFVITVAIAPEGATLDYTARYLQPLEQAMSARPEIARYFAVAGFPVVSQAILFAGLVPWEERTVKQQEVAAALFGPYFADPGVLAFPVNPPSLGQSPIERPVNFVLQTTGPYSELQAAVDAVMAEARNYPGLQNLDTDLRLNKPQLRVVVERDKVQSLGISEEQIARTLETMLGGRKVTQFKLNGKQYEVIVQVDRPDRSQPSDLRGIYVRANDGTLVQLANVARIEETVAPRELNHFNKLRSARITATPAPGFTQGDGLNFLVATANRILPAGVQYDFDGQSREFRSTSQGLVLTFVLALFFIYLVLAAQFESFIHPFTIMLSVPLAISGALLALFLTGQTLNVYSQIGLVTLIGLITKNGILIVEFANQLREQGLATVAAVEESASLRLRPILMTTLATILGAVPLASAVGAGAESRQAIGWVIVGGMSFGTLFTLYVVPVVYTLLAGGRAAAHPHALAQPAE
ncbi:MAG: efflux RND transporter permease subunit [Acetobacteraceae bacterium]|nr:efflux RND transporter permease subunit [Acetobacteraceae bacterium]